MNHRLINKLVELRKQKILVADGELTLAGKDGTPLGLDAIEEYGEFVEENKRQRRAIESRLNAEEVAFAEQLFMRWYREYLTDDIAEAASR